MNGKKVYINQTFFPKNSVFVGDDTKTKIKFTNESIKHPPLHGNCRCSLLGVYNESEMPNNPLKFREESERRLQILNEREEEKQKAIELVEKLTQAQEKIKERNKKLDERENKIKEIEKML
jgi:flagellar motility protein MotE (MotC chaperone)